MKNTKECNVHLPPGTTARGAANIYQRAFINEYLNHWRSLFKAVQAAKNDGAESVAENFVAEPHVFYAIAYTAIGIYGDINIALDDADGTGNLRVCTKVNPHERLCYNLQKRVYFRQHLNMNDEQIEHRMARMHRFLFPDVVLATLPENEDAGAPKSIATAPDAAATKPANPVAPAPVAASAKSANPVVTAAEPAKPVAPTTAHPLRQFVASWVILSLLLYVLVMALYTDGFIALE